MADINYEYTPVTIIRGDSTVIDNTPIIDGQILFDESRKCLLMDNGEIRSKYSGLGANSNLATLEDTTTATHPYVKGDYVVVEGALYLVLSAIAIGDTFTVGTNIRQVTVGEELTQIQNDLTGNYLGNAIPFRFGIDSNGDYGYIKAGADTVTPFRTNHTGTYTATARGAALDMGQYHTYRYVNTNSVPNYNMQVAYFTQNTGGNYDLGETNNYRYVNVSISGSAGWIGENITNTTNSVNIGGLTSGSKYIITAVSSNQAVPEISGGATVLAHSSSFPAYSAQQQIRTFYLQATATTININNAGRYTCFKILP